MIAPVGLPRALAGPDHLGSEFLTWLWWRADQAPCFRRSDGRELYVHVDEHLEFRGERAASRRTILRAGAPGASMDARAALRSGKLLAAVRLLFASGEDETKFTLRAPGLDVSALRLPPPSDDVHPSDRLEEALAGLDRFWDDLDHCFGTFLEVRTGGGWEAEVERVGAWAATRSAEERPA